MFVGIEIPIRVGLERSNLELLRTLARCCNETPEQLLQGSVGMCAIWGDIITDSGFVPGIHFGVADNDDNVSLFNIEAEAQALGKRFNGDNAGEAAQEFEIPSELAPSLQVVSGYFAVEPKLLFSVAIGIRHETIQKVKAGLSPVYLIIDENQYFDLDLDQVLPK